MDGNKRESICLLFIIYYLLFIIYYFIIYYLLFIIHYSLYAMFPSAITKMG